MSTKFKSIYRCALSGLSHNDYALHARTIQAGDELTLERDIGNRFDDFAIKVKYDEDQIGWIPKGQNEILARLLDAEYDLRARVISHDPRMSLNRRLYVNVYIAVAE